MNIFDYVENKLKQMNYEYRWIDLTPYYQLTDSEETDEKEMEFWGLFYAWFYFLDAQYFLKACHQCLSGEIDVWDFAGIMVDYKYLVQNNVADFKSSIYHERPNNMPFNDMALDFIKIIDYVEYEIESLTDPDPLSEEEFQQLLQKHYDHAQYWVQKATKTESIFDRSDQENKE